MQSVLKRSVAGAVAAASACVILLLAGSPFEAEARQESPEPSAEAVWSYLQSEDFTNWELFPGTSVRQAGNMPHGARVTLRANGLAQRALASGTTPLPFGSIITKENHMPDGALAATTVMLKSAGYDSENNDWFWLNRGADGTINAEGRVQGCQDCHRQASARDYVMTETP